MATLLLQGGLLKQILVLGGPNAHVLLTKSTNVGVDVVVLLHHDQIMSSSIAFDDQLDGWDRLTSCSDNGTLLSLSLWTPADAEPSKAAAARTETVFMMDAFPSHKTRTR